jgi:hypothetical protein
MWEVEKIVCFIRYQPRAKSWSKHLWGQFFGLEFLVVVHLDYSIAPPSPLGENPGPILGELTLAAWARILDSLRSAHKILILSWYVQ